MGALPGPSERFVEDVLPDGTKVTPYNTQMVYARPPGHIDPPRKVPSTLAEYMGNPLQVPSKDRVVVWELHRPDRRDAAVVEHSVPLCACTVCNEAAIPMGSTCEALAKTGYVCSYVTVEDQVLRASVPVIHAAKMHADLYPSVAPDVHTEQRTAKHVLTRIINSLTGKIEVSGEMAAAALLGQRSFTCSHKFWYVFPWPALEYVRAQRSENDVAEASAQVERAEESCPVEGSAGAAIAPQYEVYQEQDENCPDDVALDLEMDEAGRLTVTPQHINYAHRGDALRDLCLYEYGALIVIRTKSERPEGTRGRRPNQSFCFDAEHPLAASHEQVLRSQPCIPILAGRGSPPAPAMWHTREAERFASYFMVLFVPWEKDCRGPRIPLTGGGFARWAYDVDQGGSTVERARLQVIRQIVALGRVPNKTKVRQVVWRNRHRTIWGQRDDVPDAGVGAPQSGAEARAMENLDNVIALLRDEARPLPDLRSGEFELNRKRGEDGADRVLRLFGAGVPPSSLPSVSALPVLPLTKDAAGQLLKEYSEVCNSGHAPAVEGSGAGLPSETDQGDTIDISPEPTLTSEQQGVFKRALEHLRRRQQGESSSAFLELLQAPGGTGKSYVARAIKRRAPEHVLVVAPTGIAAANLGGMTVQNALALHRSAESLTEKKLAEITQALDGVWLIICDEVSMAGALMVKQIDERLRLILRASSPFGGIGMLWMGDFFQLPPVLDFHLASALVHSVVGFDKGAKHVPEQKQASALFRRIRRTVLTVQKRAQGDSRQARLVSLLRSTSSLPDEALSLLRSRTLTAAMVRADPSWSWAPIVTILNVERLQINWVQLRRFATVKGLPILRWRRSLCDNKEYGGFYPAQKEKLYVDNELQLSQSFV